MVYLLAIASPTHPIRPAMYYSGFASQEETGQNNGNFLWGEYGFKDAFNLTENWCSEIYMGLNQAPMTVMIENYRTGLIWKQFMQDQEIQSRLKKLAEAKSE